MSRSVKEWMATHDDQAIPTRVKERVHDRASGKCAICTRPTSEKLRPAFDHIQALINGGEHRESNLQLLCVPCHSTKTKADVAEKSITYRKKVKHLGLAKAKRPFPGSKASGFKRKMNGEVERR